LPLLRKKKLYPAWGCTDEMGRNVKRGWKSAHQKFKSLRGFGRPAVRWLKAERGGALERNGWGSSSSDPPRQRMGVVRGNASTEHSPNEREDRESTKKRSGARGVKGSYSA